MPGSSKVQHSSQANFNAKSEKTQIKGEIWDSEWLFNNESGNGVKEQARLKQTSNIKIDLITMNKKGTLFSYSLL